MTRKVKVNLQPLPLDIELLQIDLGGTETYILLQISHAMGVSSFFLPPKLAREVGESLVDLATAAGVGLLLPPRGPQ